MRNTRNSGATPGCCFTMSGNVTEIYEGKSTDYLTVKVQRGNYYDLFRVAVTEDTELFGLYSVGCACKISGRVTTFWNKEKKVSITNFYADSFEVIGA